ncbi:MAG: C45 family peptidase, partial [Paracoccaceae bacterium]
MLSEVRDLGWVAIQGGPRAIGLALGAAGRAAVHGQLLPSAIWHLVNDPRHADRLARMAATVQTRHPAIWAEIEGLAEGLALPVAQVFAWNCRGDLLASAPDGCTTVMLPGDAPVLAHNEDGLPFFRGAAVVADAAPDQAPGFRAFCYPGSIPGHTFAFTDAGLVQTVNNMRLTGVEPEIPRMVLGRAVLGAPCLNAALTVLKEAPPSGGFHFALTHVKDRRILSVEFGGGEVSVVEITQ